ncbi:MAG: SRPBCC family protein [Vampirovibrionales bacterium]
MKPFLRKLRFASTVAVPAEMLFAWHESPEAFQTLTPPWETVVLAHPSATLHSDSIAVILIPLLGKPFAWLPKVFPFWLPWVARHHNYVAGQQFEDTQVFGPFAAWTHVHRCLPHESEAGYSILEDDITYTLPLSPWFDWILHPVIDAKLRGLFAYRHQITQQALGSL